MSRHNGIWRRIGRAVLVSSLLLGVSGLSGCIFVGGGHHHHHHWHDEW